MIKIKVTKGESYWTKRGDVSKGCNTYTYAVYLFGYMIHAINIHNLTYDEAVNIFGDKMP